MASHVPLAAFLAASGKAPRPSIPTTLQAQVRRAGGAQVSVLEILQKLPQAQREAWVDAHPHDAARLHRALEKRERNEAR